MPSVVNRSQTRPKLLDEYIGVYYFTHLQLILENKKLLY